MSGEKGRVAQRGPIVQKDVQPGEYWWCACGLSAAQPFCDGSHTAEGKIAPLRVVIDEPKKVVAWCGCKQTASPPFCDGAHGSLKGD